MNFAPPDPSSRRPAPVAGRRPARRVRRTAAWLALAALTFGAGMVAHDVLVVTPSSLPSTVKTGDAASGRAEMVAILSDRYFRQIDLGQLATVDAADFSTALDDPYTRFLTKADYDRFTSEELADAAGLGVDVVSADAGLEISRVFPGSPAEQGGLRPDDVIVAVDDALLRGVPLVDALHRLKGDAGTTVEVAVQRNGAIEVLPIVRRRTGDWMVAAELRRLDDRFVGYVALLDFSEGAGAMTRSAVDSLLDAGATSIVLDLRGNPGGWASEAVRVAEVFLPDGAPVLTERGAHIDTTTYVTHAAPVDPHVPLVVLVDGETASSAEIVSGALRDNGRAELIGETTFGKGRIQDVVALHTGGAFKFTIAEYLTPSGFALDGVGLLPDLTATAMVVGGVDLPYYIAATQMASHPSLVQESSQ